LYVSIPLHLEFLCVASFWWILALDFNKEHVLSNGCLELNIIVCGHFDMVHSMGQPKEVHTTCISFVQPLNQLYASMNLIKLCMHSYSSWKS